FFFFVQAEDGIRDRNVTGVQTCALPIYLSACSDNIVTPFLEPFQCGKARQTPRRFAKPVPHSCGCLAWWAVAASKAWAMRRSSTSAPGRATICTPTGSPEAENPAGTETAGHPVAEIRHSERIQSR